MSSQSLILALLLTLISTQALPTVRQTGAWAQCSSQPGVCIDTNSYSCSTPTLSGLCQGLSNIRCCPFPGGVSSSDCSPVGVCTLSENCPSTPLTGKCPGPSAVTCCTSSGSGCTLGTASGCLTDVASGLTAQLVDELNDMGVTFSRLSDQNRFRCSSPCEPYLQTDAHNALASATSSVNDFITLNSAYRSSAQQYLLYNWFQKKQCNIPLAAKPGTSNHEGGLAVDTNSYSFWRPILQGFSWVWLGSRDPFHFDYTGGGVSGVPRESLRAFQRLWNRNNPGDTILEDGLFGDQTADRLSKAPCDGW